MKIRLVDRIGKRFGRLILTGINRRENGVAWVDVACDCGRIKVMRPGNIFNGNARSCGCLHNEELAERSTTHGKRYHDLYRRWQMMKTRCYCPTAHRFRLYGARGIKVCARWRNSFPNFLADMESSFRKGLTLERKNNNENYTPKNCRWATQAEQCNNQRTNRLITIDGVTHNIAQWARLSGVSYSAVQSRLKRGVEPRIAVFAKSLQ